MSCSHGNDGQCDTCELQWQTAAGVRPDRKLARISFLERKRQVTIEDCKVKLEAGDYHGVADAAMDLRDIENELDGLRFE